MARFLNEVEYAWSSESEGRLPGVWQLFKGEQRALGEPTAPRPAVGLQPLSCSRN